MKKIMKHMESVFDISYLLIIIYLVFEMVNINYQEPLKTYMIITVAVLGLGDSFHLVPRVINHYSKKSYHKAMGRGLQISSITMSIFYVMLWHIGRIIYNQPMGTWTWVIYGLMFARIIMCLLPQNKWTEKDRDGSFALYRNIPFLIQGGITAIMFFINSQQLGELRYMWLGILLSFAFYMPVVLFVSKNRKMGMFMLPKTCAYIWMMFMLIWQMKG